MLQLPVFEFSLDSYTHVAVMHYRAYFLAENKKNLVKTALFSISKLTMAKGNSSKSHIPLLGAKKPNEKYQTKAVLQNHHKM